ncbi:RNA polymerase sigma factor [Pedobacter sp. SAFR-022]|uniref:RNA polymerase sigma factor n=1 Tax=Pedobacter sp. SAFR-022 TaxID=3436861 RepID=UPI003F7D43BD
MYEENVKILEDSALVLQVAAQNRLAFDELYDRHFKLVYNAAFKRLNSADQAADIAQEVFVQLWTRKSTAPIENLPAYLFTLVRNNVFKFLEREQRYQPLPELFDRWDGSTGNADAVLLYQEFVVAFEQLVSALSPQQQIIFRMRYEQELSPAEIADKLDISPKTVRNQLGKALFRLKSAVAISILFYFIISGRL